MFERRKETKLKTLWKLNVHSTDIIIYYLLLNIYYYLLFIIKYILLFIIYYCLFEKLQSNGVFGDIMKM